MLLIKALLMKKLVVFFLPSKGDVKCVYLIFQWGNIVQRCIRMYCYKDVYVNSFFPCKAQLDSELFCLQNAFL